MSQSCNATREQNKQETDANTRVARLWEDDLIGTASLESWLDPSTGKWSHY
jgi:hypothetical protein